LNAKTHPIGHQVTYAKFWRWLSCMGTNPCEGWLNPADSTRAFTSSRAARLNQEYEMVRNKRRFFVFKKQ